MWKGGGEVFVAYLSSCRGFSVQKVCGDSALSHVVVGFVAVVPLPMHGQPRTNQRKPTGPRIENRSRNRPRTCNEHHDDTRGAESVAESEDCVASGALVIGHFDLLVAGSYVSDIARFTLVENGPILIVIVIARPGLRFDSLLTLPSSVAIINPDMYFGSTPFLLLWQQNLTSVLYV